MGSIQVEALDSIPVGSIVAYAADNTTQLPKQGWAVCNGGQYSASTNPELFAAIGYSNGGSGDLFYLPDLRGQFIRGSGLNPSTGAILKAGAVTPATTANPGFNLSISYMPQDYHHVDDGAIGPLSKNMVYWNGDSTTFTLSGGDHETRPVNQYFHYIIKVNAVNSVPLGSVIPYAGSDDNSPDDPWQACNGNSIKVKSPQYSGLYGVIGSRFSNSAGGVNFNLPSLAGIFVRGVDTGSGSDPDADSREAAPDGTTGRAVGTLQTYGTSAKGLSVSIPHYPPSSTFEVYPTAGHDNLYSSNNSSNNTFGGGADESRPDNAYVQYYINATSQQPNTDAFPVGGIVAIPGNGTAAPNPDYWVVADGSSVDRAGKYAALWNIMSLSQGSTTAWGTSDGDHFNLPDLRGRYLRATDLSINNDPWGDPDRNNRQASAPGGTNKGTGSVQSFATGTPKNPFNINVNYPTDDHENAATAVGKEMSEYNSSSQTFQVSGGDPETAPTGVVVNFYVKFATAASAAYR